MDKKYKYKKSWKISWESTKLNDRLENIGDRNTNKLEGFLFDVKKEKGN